MGYSKLAIGSLLTVTLIVTVQSMRLEVNIQPVPMPGALKSLSPSGGSLPTSANSVWSSDSNLNLMSRQSCPKEKECQKVRVSTRKGIVGGCVVKPNSIPWQVAIVDASKQTEVGCGGSIICPKFVLSAAHCFKRVREGDRQVAVGMHNRFKSDEVEFHEIKKLHKHHNWNPEAYNNDFAIVELKDPIGLDKHDAKAIYLPPAPAMPTPPVGTHFFVSGWGRLSMTGSGCYPQTLNAVSLPSISLKDCEKAYAPDNWPVTPQMICTSYPGGGKDTCSGDSGGMMKIMSLLLEIEHVTSTYFTQVPWYGSTLTPTK